MSDYPKWPDYPKWQSKKKLDELEQLMREEKWKGEVKNKTNRYIYIAALSMTILPSILFIFLSFINSPEFPKQNTSNVSNSMSVEKVIAWFCAGALGYAAFYAIGKNIAKK